MSCLLQTWEAVNTSRVKRCRFMTRCQPPFMLRQPVVTLYSLISHACTIVEPCVQIGSSQISNSDIRLKKVINDTFSDVFSAQWESDCPTVQIKSEGAQQCINVCFRWMCWGITPDTDVVCGIWCVSLTLALVLRHNFWLESLWLQKKCTVGDTSTLLKLMEIDQWLMLACNSFHSRFWKMEREKL